MATIVTENAVRLAAEQMGIAGRPVCVHASLRSFGRVEGGASAVVRGLLAAGSTVLAPTFSYAFGVPPPDDRTMRPDRNGIDYASLFRDRSHVAGTFTPASADLDRESMGAVPGAVLAMPDRVRGDHPINSFTAAGPLAHALVDGQSPEAVYRPLEMLSALGGWVILMGVGLQSMTLLHLAEKLVGREPFRRWARDSSGKVMMVQVGGCSRGFDNFEPVLAPLERHIAVGESRWRAYPAKRTLEVAVEAIRRDPHITTCGHPACERCRDAVAGGPALCGE